VSLTFTDHYIKFISSNGVTDDQSPFGSVIIHAGVSKNPSDFSEFGLTLNVGGQHAN
jgi:hypothetical protein